MPLEPTPLAAILKETIRAHGPITFAEYMDACLYHPEHGYYTMSHQQPRRDYFTNVDASPIYGRLLTRQFQQWEAEHLRPVLITVKNSAMGGSILLNQLTSKRFFY